MSKAFSQFGKDLGITLKNSKGEEKRISLFQPEDLKRRKIKDSANPSTDPLTLSI